MTIVANRYYRTERPKRFCETKPTSHLLSMDVTFRFASILQSEPRLGALACSFCLPGRAPRRDRPSDWWSWHGSNCGIHRRCRPGDWKNGSLDARSLLRDPDPPEGCSLHLCRRTKSGAILAERDTRLDRPPRRSTASVQKNPYIAPANWAHLVNCSIRFQSKFIAVENQDP